MDFKDFKDIIHSIYSYIPDFFDVPYGGFRGALFNQLVDVTVQYFHNLNSPLYIYVHEA